MKKHLLKSSLFAGVLALLFSSPCGKGGGLKEITKPYLGEYECENATFSGRDLLTEFSYIRLELKEDGTFLLHGKTKTGKTHKEQGVYTYDAEREELCLSLGKDGELKRNLPLKNGAFCIDVSFGGKSLHMQFQQK